MKYVKTNILLLLFLSSSFIDCIVFKCSFNQLPKQYNCWTMSFLCSLELYFLLTPKAMEPRRPLLTNREVLDQEICHYLSKNIGQTSNNYCSIDSIAQIYSKSKHGLELKNALLGWHNEQSTLFYH